MRFEIIKGDITLQEVDAIVNAANTSLLGGAGVDGAIHRAAGRSLLEECRKLKGCETGQAKITKGYDLPAGFVIHTPGPIWNGGSSDEMELLTGSYYNSLVLAVKHKCRTVAFPSISTGAYGYPLEEAAGIAVTTILNFLEENEALEKVYMVCFDDKTKAAYERALSEALEDYEEEEAEVLEDSEIALLKADVDKIEADVIISLLKSFNIPVMKKSKGTGELMEIYFGSSKFGVDLYVPSKALKEALELINKQ